MAWEKDYERTKECGCVYEGWSDDWFQHEERYTKRCQHAINKALRKELERQIEYNKYIEALNKKMETIEFDRIPIKYYYDKFNIKQRIFKRICQSDIERFNIHKHKSRYYCCKNRVDYYFDRPPQDRFIY
jgi:hypothetical protein